MSVPKDMEKYLSAEDSLLRNAMLLYPSIHNNSISFGRAAEILGIHKIDLVTLYGRMGINFVDMTDEEFEEELCNAEKAKEKTKDAMNGVQIGLGKGKITYPENFQDMDKDVKELFNSSK